MKIPRFTCHAIVAALAGAGLASCSFSGPMAPDATTFLTERGLLDQPVPGAFSHCSTHTCQKVETVSLDDDEWRAITAPLDTPAADAQAERERLRAAVAAYERTVGGKTGTAADIGGTGPGFFKRRQLDCVDETSNTTTLLVMLDEAGLLRFHRPGPPAMRGNFVTALPHRTATIVESDGERTFAIDAWFHDNGEPPEIVALDAWIAGWEPEGEEVASF